MPVSESLLQQEGLLRDFASATPKGRLSLDVGAHMQSDAGWDAHARVGYGISDSLKLAAGTWALDSADGLGTRYGAGVSLTGTW